MTDLNKLTQKETKSLSSYINIFRICLVSTLNFSALAGGLIGGTLLSGDRSFIEAWGTKDWLLVTLGVVILFYAPLLLMLWIFIKFDDFVSTTFKNQFSQEDLQKRKWIVQIIGLLMLFSQIAILFILLESAGKLQFT